MARRLRYETPERGLRMKDKIRNTVDGKEIIHLYGKRDVKWEGIEPSCFDGRRNWFDEHFVGEDGILVTFSNGRYGYEYVYSVDFHYKGRNGKAFEIHQFEKEGARTAAYGFFCIIRDTGKYPAGISPMEIDSIEQAAEVSV
jgi:hypothetical protein